MTNPLTLDIPAGVPWIDFTREFDAPVEAVFNAHRDPELVTPVARPARLRDGHRALGLHVRRRLPLHPPRRRQRLRLPRHVPHGARRTTSPSRPSSSRARPTRSPSSSCASSTSATAAAGSRATASARTVEGRDVMVESGMETGHGRGLRAARGARRRTPTSAIRLGPGLSAMDWTLEVVIVPVSDLGAAIAFYRDQVGFDLDHDTQQRAHARRPADAARVRVLDRHRRPAVADRRWRPARCTASSSSWPTPRRRASELVGRGVECSEIHGLRRARRRHVLRLRRPRRQLVGRAAAQGPGREAAHPARGPRSLRRGRRALTPGHTSRTRSVDHGRVATTASARSRRVGTPSGTARRATPDARCSSSPTRPRAPGSVPEGGVYTFVTGGIESALDQARAAADGRTVTVMGGADLGRQCLAAGLVDEVSLHVAPVLFGRGTPMFAGLDVGHVHLELLEAVGTPRDRPPALPGRPPRPLTPNDAFGRELSVLPLSS